MPKILIHSKLRRLPLSRTHLRRVIAFFLSQLQVNTDEVSFYFVGEAEISRLHKQFFHDATVTDCITLPLDSPNGNTAVGYHILGEAFICLPIAAKYAKEHGLPLAEELYRYLIHCLLHFLGYTDATPQSRTRMRRKETLYLKKLLFTLKQTPPALN